MIQTTTHAHGGKFMYCMKCQNDLAQCTCPDLAERLKAIRESGAVIISPERQKAYDDQANRNQTEQTREE